MYTCMYVYMCVICDDRSEGGRRLGGGGRDMGGGLASAVCVCDGSIGIIWNPLESFGIHWNPLGSMGRILKPLISLRIINDSGGNMKYSLFSPVRGNIHFACHILKILEAEMQRNPVFWDLPSNVTFFALKGLSDWMVAWRFPKSSPKH